MTGKIFKESSNIYQDQAKILFDYYKAAAETIVAAEIAEEQNKADLIRQRDEMIAVRNKSKTIAIVMFALFFFIVTIVIGIVYLVKYFKCKDEVERFDGLIVQCDERYRNIR